jgi:hypothetical protein
MAEEKKRRPRITKGDSFQFVREESTGELLVRCRFCDAKPYPVNQHWGHHCEPSQLKPSEDPFVKEDDNAA